MPTEARRLRSKLPDVGTTIFTVMSKLAAEHDAINLSQGFPDFDCDPELIETVERHLRAGHNQYAPMQGVTALREALAHRITRLYGAVYDPDTEITVTSGATEALFCVIAACVGPGDEAIVIEPCYDSYVPVIQLCGGTPVFVTVGAAKLLIGAHWESRPETIAVHNPLDGRLVGTIPAGTAEDVDRAVTAAVAALDSELPSHARYEILMRAADRIDAMQGEYARTIALEGSKTIREARREPSRAATILRLSAEEARRIAGETLPFDARPGSENRAGYYFRVPVGVVGAITPFNDPLAVAAHKIGPALAAGNAVVLKPASATPFSAIRLARDLAAAGLPAGRVNLVTGRGATVGNAIVTNPRIRMLNFTGGLQTGERITARAGLKKLSLELGSNSPVIVLRDALLDRAVPAIAAGAFAQAGQNCLGVQRVMVDERIYDVVDGSRRGFCVLRGSVVMSGPSRADVLGDAVPPAPPAGPHTLRRVAGRRLRVPLHRWRQPRAARGRTRPRRRARPNAPRPGRHDRPARVPVGVRLPLRAPRGARRGGGVYRVARREPDVHRAVSG